MLKKQEDQQTNNYSKTEQQLKQQELYIPLKNWLCKCYEKSGFANKTLWDILQSFGGATLLTGIVSIVAWGINQNFQQHQKDIETQRYQQEKHIETQRYQQTALDNYFKEMTNIIVEKKLGILHHVPTDNQKSNEQEPISQSINILEELEKDHKINKEQKDRIVEVLNKIKESQVAELEAIARAQTLTTLNLLRLDSIRRDLLINFLRETTLATKDRTCVERDDTSKRCKKQDDEAKLLIGINLRNIELPDTNLGFFILREADFGNAKLLKANFSSADLKGSNLSSSDLREAFLIKTDLRGAILKNANLTNADLSKADLRSQNTDLTNANLTNANLFQAIPPNPKSQYARPELVEQDFPNTYLCNTTMPNGYMSKRDCRKLWKKN